MLEAHYQHVLLVRQDRDQVQIVTRMLSEAEQAELRRGRDHFPTDTVQGEVFLWNFMVGENTLKIYRPRADGRGEVLVKSHVNVFKSLRPWASCEGLDW